ncbi:RNase H family protein [Gordonia terrae]
MTSDLGRDRARPREALYHVDGERFAWEEIIDSVSRELKDGSGEGWVLVPGKRVATAEKLFEHGLPVTRGRCGENRAIDKAIERMQYYRQHEEAPHSTRSRQCGNRVRRTAHVASDLRAPHWFPSAGATRLRPTETLIVATDASIGRNGVVAAAAVSDRGETVLDVTDRSANASEAELRAMVLAIEALAGSVRREMCILSDSADAVDIANTLIDGRFPARGARGIGELDVNRFVAAWQRSSCAIAVHQLKAHVGHPLNEAADELASIGRLATLHPRVLVENELRQRIAVISAGAVALTESQVRVPTPSYSIRRE